MRTEFGKTIGGFSQYAWDAVSNSYLNEVGKNSFIFSLDLKEKFVPVGTNNLIYCNTDFGPTFGNGHDLFISDQCDANKDSCAIIATAYNREG